MRLQSVVGVVVLMEPVVMQEQVVALVELRGVGL